METDYRQQLAVQCGTEKEIRSRKMYKVSTITYIRTCIRTRTFSFFSSLLSILFLSYYPSFFFIYDFNSYFYFYLIFIPKYSFQFHFHLYFSPFFPLQARFSNTQAREEAEQLNMPSCEEYSTRFTYRRQ